MHTSLLHRLSGHLDERLGYAGRIGLYYASFFTVLGTAMPYFNVWLESLGLTLREIALVAAASPLVRIFAGPVISFYADRHMAHRLFLVVIGWGYLGAWMLMSQARLFWTVLIAQVLISLTSAALIPLIETIAVTAVRTRGIDYGRARLWGSVTFIVASLIGGWLVDWNGVGMAMGVILFGAALTAFSGHLLPPPEPPSETRKPLRLADAINLVKSPHFLLFLVAVGMVQGAHALLYVFSVLHWRSLGISNGWCGALWAISVGAEVILFWGATRWFKGVQPLGYIAIGAVAAIVRWTAMAFDPPLALLVPLQLLHGLTYGASHLGAMQYLAKAVPTDQAGTGQSVYALVTGSMFIAVATQVAGIAYEAMRGRAYGFMALFACVSLVAVVALHKLQRARA